MPSTNLRRIVFSYSANSAYSESSCSCECIFYALPYLLAFSVESGMFINPVRWNEILVKFVQDPFSYSAVQLELTEEFLCIYSDAIGWFIEAGLQE